MKKDPMPESLQEKESLTSSNALPSFEDVSNVYAELIKATEEMENEKPKKKGKKSTQAKESTPEPQEESTDIKLSASDIADMLAFPLDAYFIRNDKEPLSQHEKENLAIASANLINKYLPMTSKYKEELAFAMSIGVIFFSRMKVENADTGNTENTSTPQEKAA